MWISGEPFVFTDWSTNQPDNDMSSDPAGEMCITIRNPSQWSPAEFAKWNDQPCSTTGGLRPICKQEQTV